MRDFVETELMPYIDQWDENYQIPKSVNKKLAEARLLPFAIGPSLKNFKGGKIQLPPGMEMEQFDSFSEMIFVDEVCRCGKYQ